MKALLRVCLLCCCALTLLSCAAMEPRLREQAMAPGAVQAGKKPRAAEKEDLSLTGQAPSPAEEKQRAREILREMEQDNELFNSRLKQVIGMHDAPAPGDREASAKEVGGDQQQVSFNFYDADLADVVRLFMDLLEDDYVFQPNVGGRVSLKVEDTFNRNQLVELLQGIMRINGVTMVKDDNGIWEIMPLSDAAQSIPDQNLILPDQEARPNRGQIIRAFRLHYIAASEIVKIIQPYLAKGALIYAHDPTGVLIVSDFPHTLPKVTGLIELFDESVFADMQVRVYALKYAVASEVAKELESLAQTMGFTPDKGGPSSRISFLAMDRLNKLLAVTKSERLLEFADIWVEELDQDVPQIAQDAQVENIYVYYVQNGDAEEIVTSLQGLFERSPDTRDREDTEQLPVGQQLREEQEQQVTEDRAVVESVGAVSGSLVGEVSFVVDQTTNSILIRCVKSDYDKIYSVIEKLDLYPKQVLIEVLIADVQLDESSKLGIEWSFVFDLANDTESELSVDSGLGVIGGGDSLIGSGLTYLVTHTDKLTAVLKALAEDNKVNVLSSPHILASDNQEARIDIGDEVPIVTSELRTTEAGSTATTVDKTIQYRDTGILLTVTPHINEKGLVRMDVSQEVSQISDRTVQGVDSPIFSKRLATTRLAVQDEQTIVIGGLIRQSNSDGYTGIPVLGRVPILKYLVGTQQKSFSSSELLIFITPHVIKSAPDADLISNLFLKRLKELKQDFLTY
ncbi:MAG: type II secretion system secretin GspD [Desulfohalobiaceae bacterium]